MVKWIKKIIRISILFVVILLVVILLLIKTICYPWDFLNDLKYYRLKNCPLELMSYEELPDTLKYLYCNLVEGIERIKINENKDTIKFFDCFGDKICLSLDTNIKEFEYHYEEGCAGFYGKEIFKINGKSFITTWADLIYLGGGEERINIDGPYIIFNKSLYFLRNKPCHCYVLKIEDKIFGKFNLKRYLDK